MIPLCVYARRWCIFCSSLCGRGKEAERAKTWKKIFRASGPAYRPTFRSQGSPLRLAADPKSHIEMKVSVTVTKSCNDSGHSRTRQKPKALKHPQLNGLSET